MRVLITGAGGMLGVKLSQCLAGEGRLGGRAISHLSLVDLVRPDRPAGASFDVDTLVADLADPACGRDLISNHPDVVFHLAAVVSGEAEADLEKGYRVNVDATRLLFDAIRTAGQDYRPRVVFTSSIAVFGPPFPEVIGDDHATTPSTSYGTQKAMVELLLADYTRRGFLDGIGIRLPTICVRPGRPNPAASGFFSGIIREPLAGKDATLPVPDSVRHWFASPRAAVGFLLHAATLRSTAVGICRNLTMPGLSATVAEQIEALASIAGDAVVRHIRRAPDETIARIVSGWPRRFDAARARALGFRAESSFADIILAHIEDELGGRVGTADP